MSQETPMQPFAVDIDLASGAMADPDTVITRRASDMRGYYADADALERIIGEQHDPVHYEVFEKDIPEAPGHLRICVSKLYPGTVGRECFMTKGHYHTVSGTAEIYLCLQGRGFMLMKTKQGACLAERMVRNGMVYVPPHWAHRSVNTGEEPLVSFCVYPGEAGHNYGDIVEQGFPRRVYLQNGEEVIA